MRGQEVDVKIRTRLRSTVDGTLSEIDLSGSPALTWRAVEDFDPSTTEWIEKTSASGDITVFSDGTSGAQAVIKFTLSESDLGTIRKGYWVLWIVKGGVTTPLKPGRFEIEPYPTL